jgi:ATP-dependent Clp protease ATP-binding subunit ClpA
LQKELGRRRPSILVTEDDNAAARFTHKVSSTTEGSYFMPFVGRASELKSGRTLLLREKSSIMIVGEPGAGKTTFAQKLACTISEAAIEAGLEYGSMYKLRTPVLLSSVESKEELDDNFIDVLNEIVASKSIILIENLALLLHVSASKYSRIAELLDEYVSSKGLLMVATATPEGRSSCESEHGNIMQFLEVVNLQEPSDKETLEILKGARKSLEIEHSVIVSDDALTAVLNLSENLQAIRALPAKAFELLDQACMTAKLNADINENSDFQVIVTAEQVKDVMTRSFESK